MSASAMEAWRPQLNPLLADGSTPSPLSGKLCDTNQALNYKTLSYRRGTARRARSAEILSTDAQLCEKCSLKACNRT